MSKKSPQAINDADLAYRGSRFAEVKEALFANPYQKVWGAADAPPLPRYKGTLWSLLRPGVFRQAAERTIGSKADLRWGPDGKGVQRLLHPNGIILTGLWEITEDNPYSGYFRKGSRGLVIARSSSHGTHTTRDKKRSYSIAGKIFATTDPDHAELLKPANFFTQHDLGGTRAQRISDVAMRNTPDVTLLNRGKDIPILLLSGLVFKRADAEPARRQLHDIAELGPPGGGPNRAPEFMQLTVSPGHLAIEEDDYRDEIMAHIFDRGDPAPKRKLSFDISVADKGRSKGKVKQRWIIEGWKKIGTLVFDNAVISHNGDFVIHFHHPPWREKK